MAYTFKYNAFTDNFDMVLGGLSVPQTGWPTPTHTTDKQIDATATSLTEVANTLATLITTLKTAGILSS